MKFARVIIAAKQKQSEHSHLRMAKYITRDGRNSHLQIVCRVLRGMNIDFGVFTEAKNNGIYSKTADGYKVVAMEAKSGKGGVALFYRNVKGWSLESTNIFCPNGKRSEPSRVGTEMQAPSLQSHLGWI